MTRIERTAAAITRPEFPAGVYVLTPADLPGGRLPDGCGGLASPSLDLVARPQLGRRWRGRKPAVAVDPAGDRGRANRWWRRAGVRGTLAHELAHLLEFTARLGRRWWADRPADPATVAAVGDVFQLAASRVVSEAAALDAREVDGHGPGFLLAVLVLIERADRLNLPVSRWAAGPTSFLTAPLTAYKAAYGPIDPDVPYRALAAVPPPAAFLALWRADREAALGLSG